MLASMNVRQLSFLPCQGHGAITPFRTLIAAAFYLLLGLYSGHLMVCGAEFCGHGDGELVHLKSGGDGPDHRSEGALIRAASVGTVMAGAGTAPTSAAVDAATPLIVALGLAAVLFLAMASLDRSWPSRRIGQPVGRWYRTVVLLI